jgi:hypothetical protein
MSSRRGRRDYLDTLQGAARAKSDAISKAIRNSPKRWWLWGTVATGVCSRS